MVKNRTLIAVAVCIIVVLSVVSSSYGMTRSKTETISNFKSLCDSHSSVASYESLGKSVQDKDIWVFRFGNPDGGCVMWDGQLHGNEGLGTECMWLFAQWLLGGSAKANRYLQTNYILFVPSVNIDSAFRCNMRMSYTAAEGGPLSAPYGVNLNRNFPLGFGSSGSPDPNNDVDYRGISGGSEPETKAMVDAFTKYKPEVYVNTHQWGGPNVMYSSSANITFVNQIIQIQQQYYDSTHPAYGTIDITPYRMRMGLVGGMAAYHAQEMNIGITAFLMELDPEQGFGWENRGGSWRQPSMEVIQQYYYPKFEMLMLATLDATSGQGARDGALRFSAWDGENWMAGATLSLTFPNGTVTSGLTPYYNSQAPVGSYTVECVHSGQTADNSPYTFTLTSDEIKSYTFIFGVTPPPSSAYVFEDNFDSADFSKWTATRTSSGETASVVDMSADGGGLRARFTSNGGSQVEYAYCYRTVNEEEVWASGNFYVSAGLPLDNDDDRLYFIRFMSGQYYLASVGIGRHNGSDMWVFYGRNGSGSVGPIYSSSSTAKMNRWYCVELHWKKHSTLGIMEAFVDGERILWIENENTANLGNVSQINFGLMLSLQVQKTVSVYGDCFSFSNTIGTYYTTGDVNHDTRVDLKDVAIVAKHFGFTPYELEWDPRADLNRDGIVDMRDLAIVCRAFA